MLDGLKENGLPHGVPCTQVAVLKDALDDALVLRSHLWVDKLKAKWTEMISYDGELTCKCTNI